MTHPRFRYEAVEGAPALFTDTYVEYLLALHDRVTPQIASLLGRRAEAVRRAVTQGVLPGHPARSAASGGEWKVPAVPEDLLRPGIEISGPCSITSMFINALNPGPEGERAQGIYFYLPKLEFAPEARVYRDLFDLSRERLPWLRTATLRAIVLVESLPCVYEMEEMLHELGPYAAGLNAARWDLKASIFE